MAISKISATELATVADANTLVSTYSASGTTIERGETFTLPAGGTTAVSNGALRLEALKGDCTITNNGNSTLTNASGVDGTVLMRSGASDFPAFVRNSSMGSMSTPAREDFTGSLKDASNYESTVVLPTGSVLQSYTTNVSSNSVTVACIPFQFAVVPSLQQTITPSSISSKILIIVHIGGFNFSSTNYGLAGMGVFKRKIASGSFVDVGVGSGNITFNGTFGLVQRANDQYYAGLTAMAVDEPDTTSECTYGIGVTDHNNGTQTFYLNKKMTQGNAASNGYYSSAITVMETKG